MIGMAAGIASAAAGLGYWALVVQQGAGAAAGTAFLVAVGFEARTALAYQRDSTFPRFRGVHDRLQSRGLFQQQP